ncbi:MAG: hypothetical protein RMN51_09310 [Verrucomicrobiota bacterium]|nr:hypothetical protein [Limisphaera sp.]MDW8382289.1 hypothetical protein [Verrucomicrobiota bacterium]
MAKTLLWLGLALTGIGLLLVIGLIPVGRAVGAYVTLPVGVVLLGMSLIWSMLSGQEEETPAQQPSSTGQTRRPDETSVGGGCGCGCQH